MSTDVQNRKPRLIVLVSGLLIAFLVCAEKSRLPEVSKPENAFETFAMEEIEAQPEMTLASRSSDSQRSISAKKKREAKVKKSTKLALPLLPSPKISRSLNETENEQSIMPDAKRKASSSLAMNEEHDDEEDDSAEENRYAIEEDESILNEEQSSEMFKKRKAGNKSPSELSSTSDFDDNQGPKMWDQWGKWSSCTVSCGVGKLTRWRYCVAGSCSTGEKEAQFKTCTFAAC